MQKLERYVLPENTNRLYTEEAISSIGLTRDVAAKINELVDAYNELSKEDLQWKQTQEGIIRKGVIYMKDNLVNTLYDLLKIYDKEEIKNAMMEAYGEELEALTKAAVYITPQMFGAVGDGVNDDTLAIQTAIDEANKKSRVLYMPSGVYKISEPLVLNGCSLIGEPGNVFHAAGTVIECESADFTAIKQGSTGTNDTMFNLSDILVKGAHTAIEIAYAINSKFERLYAVDCNIGFRLGIPGSVGSMFCEFNNLYTNNCVKGVVVEATKYFNNNRFNNGFLQGSELAMSLAVTGGYGAVDNTFNNVEFKSSMGRGCELTSALNTNFNHCYFECGGNAIRTLDYCTLFLNSNIYGMFKQDNTKGDVNVVYSEGGSMFTFDGGTVFLTDEYANKLFFGTGNDAVYQNVYVVRGLSKNGSASGFDFFGTAVNKSVFTRGEQVVTTGTVTVEGGTGVDVPFTYPEPFISIPNVVTYTMRGTTGAGMDVIVKERTKEGGILFVKNSGSSANSVSFSIYSKIV